MVTTCDESCEFQRIVFVPLARPATVVFVAITTLQSQYRSSSFYRRVACALELAVVGDVSGATMSSYMTGNAGQRVFIFVALSTEHIRSAWPLLCSRHACAHSESQHRCSLVIVT